MKITVCIFADGCFFAAILNFFQPLLKFSPAFFKRRRHQRRGAFVALRRARNLFYGVFFLIAFSFAPASAKEKADEEPSPAGEGVTRSVTDEEFS